MACALQQQLQCPGVDLQSVTETSNEGHKKINYADN